MPICKRIDRTKNWYLDLTKICEICGFPIMNSRTKRSIVCQDLDLTKRSNCQLVKDRIRQYEARRKYPHNIKPLYKKDGTVKKDVELEWEWRYCLGVNCNGEKLFKSTSKYNRQCDKCKREALITNVSKISFKGHSLKGMGAGDLGVC